MDSQQNRNLIIPEIDWVLNEAYELFVKMVAFPRVSDVLGFEKSQRNIDDIRPLVINADCVDVTNNIATLPVDYWHFLSAQVEMTKGECSAVKGRVHIKQHDDEFEESVFDKSSFEWRAVNGVFNEDGVKLHTDGTFTIDSFCLNYIKKLAYIHNASGYNVAGYNTPSGTLLTGTVNCELPDHTHREIVDIAVLITTGEISPSDYQVKAAKLLMNKIN